MSVAPDGCCDMTLGEIKKSRKPLEVWVSIFEHDGQYLPISRAMFFREIGADVSHRNGGLHDNTVIRAVEGERVIMIG